MNSVLDELRPTLDLSGIHDKLPSYTSIFPKGKDD